MPNSTTKTPLRNGTVVWYNYVMSTFRILLTASVFVDLEAEDYKDATTKSLKTADDLQHATTGVLKYLGIRWEVECVQEEK